ncbi:MAG: deoxyhypusine synthase [Candidatus Micrarchaeia archaeon]
MAAKRISTGARRFLRGRTIEPLRFRKDMDVEFMVERVFGASGYNARRLAEACALYGKMIRNDATVCLTLAGAMTPIGMGGPIITMMEKGLIDWIISTGANLYHDLHRAFDFPMVQGDFRVDDNELRRHHIARIYDVFIHDSATLEAQDMCIVKALLHHDNTAPMTTAELHNVIGKYALEHAPHPEKSVLAMAAKYDVPVFTPSPADSSIGMNLITPYLYGNPVVIDVVRDALQTAAIVASSRKTGGIEVGGGAPKNYFMQTHPILWQILKSPKGGHDYFIQITDARPDTGGLSGATNSEARSWGKVKDACLNGVIVYCDASIALPILLGYANSKFKERERKRLYAKLDKMTDELILGTQARDPYRKLLGSMRRARVRLRVYVSRENAR